MAIYLENKKKITSIFSNIDGEKRKIISAWIDKDGVSTKVFPTMTHVHNYVEEITKEPSCTEEGEKTYTCECGDSYTEKIPMTEHSYVDGVCTVCGGEFDPYILSPLNAYNNWDYILDENNNIITLNFYKGNENDVIVYANYIIDAKIYRTKLASMGDANTTTSNYMFLNRKDIQTVVFSKNIDVSNLNSIRMMFYDCSSIQSIIFGDFSKNNIKDMSMVFMGCSNLENISFNNFNTSLVTNMYALFANCSNLSLLKLDSFNIGSVNDASYLFYKCSNLKTIYVKRIMWNLTWVNKKTDMFTDCGVRSVTYI